MAFSVQQIRERDAALIVLHDEPPSENWLANWEHWFVRQAGDEKAHCVRKIFALAREGIQCRENLRETAKRELAEMLRSMARQIEPERKDG